MNNLTILGIILFFILFLICIFPKKWYPSRLITFRRKTTYPNKFSIIQKTEIPTVYEKVFEPRDIVELETERVVTIHDYLIDLEPVELPTKKKTPLESVISDSQNVHDSYIQTGLSYNYKPLEKTDITDADKMNMILEYSGWDPMIEKAVCRIKNRNTEMTKYEDDTEFEVLWNTFTTGCNNVKDQLLLVLKGFQLSENLPCPTGVTSQIREAAYINEPEKTPIHEALLQQYMLNKASIYAKEHNMTSELIKDKLIDEYSAIYPEESLTKIIDEWGELF